MTNLKKRERAKTNASLISMVQRFSDITIMFGGLWFICEVSGLPFLYMHLLVALITLLISPVLCCIALAVKLSSPGPVIFRQTRYGMDGKPIKVWKFRSMKVMENDKVVTQATQNDPRVTRVGNFLRRTSLDELPQFINVLTGGMSIVGPRPHAVAHNEQYRQLIEGYMLRHKMKPGITGWAQINGWRGETDTLEKMEKRVEFDLEYIREWSIWFDIKIVFLTIFKGFVNKAAY
ncbi:exopolysaccharide biosynthesis polyprenyl glycosylphosphotransferase [Salmonella enterica subsp. enterica serovar Cerro]|nr:exopolysaccharide biosynthesis polyprenyl glycosylphosphotransferase [Salmonella enterica subsp. enterica serovar Cerro]